MAEADIEIETDKQSLLEPLLDTAKQLKSEYRVRKRSYRTKSSHSADVDDWLRKGWTVQRAGKRKAIVVKPKSHDQLLEDRIWCLAHLMGYDRMNGDKFKITFRRQDGSSGQKQIDVFASDKDTVLVIECKSRSDRGRRSLQKDILETISLKEYVRRSVISSFPERSKPKIIWIYATNNIIWSENDVSRASDGNIYIMTENEIQYFEAFLRHMGPAGRYQILGEFLKGQKVPGLQGVKIPAIKGKIAGETYYSFVCTPRHLLKIAFVNHHALNHPDGKPAYQRMISSNRIKEIGQYIIRGGYFPTNIIVNFTNSPKFEFILNKENTDDNIKFGGGHGFVA